MIARWKIVVAGALAALMFVPGLAMAQSTSSSVSSSGSSFSSSSSLGSSNVLAALALGAGGGSSGIDRSAAAAFVDTPFLASDPCVVGARYRGGEWMVSNVRRSDDTRVMLAHAMSQGNGTLTQEMLAESFAGRRDMLVVAECDHARAVHVSEVLFGECAQRGRGCAMALTLRLVLDQDGIDATERQHVFDALR